MAMQALPEINRERSPICQTSSPTRNSASPVALPNKPPIPQPQSTNISPVLLLNTHIIQPTSTSQATLKTPKASPVSPLEEQYFEQSYNTYHAMVDMGSQYLGKCESPLMTFRIGFHHSGTTPMWMSVARWIQNLVTISNSRGQSHIAVVRFSYGLQGKYAPNEANSFSIADVRLSEDS